MYTLRSSLVSNLSTLSVPDEGYSSNVPDEGYSSNTSYLMKVIPATRRTWWRLFQKHVVRTKLDIYVFKQGSGQILICREPE